MTTFCNCAALGLRFGEARAQRGMSRMALAESAGVGERYLADSTLSGGNPSIVFLRRVASALGLQLLTLLESVGARPAQKLIRRFLDGLPPDRLEETLRRLTEELGLTELDQEIERDAGMSLSEVFHLYGQAGYRKIERRCLARIIDSQDDIVLTVGGGIVSEPESYELLLLNCFAVWVKALPEEHMMFSWIHPESRLSRV